MDLSGIFVFFIEPLQVQKTGLKDGACTPYSQFWKENDQVCSQFCKEMDQPARSSRGKMTKIARSLAGKWTSLIIVLQGNVPAYLYFINNLRTSWSISLLSYEQSWSIFVQNLERAINWLYMVNMEISMVKTKVGCYGNQILALQPCGGK